MFGKDKAEKKEVEYINKMGIAFYFIGDNNYGTIEPFDDHNEAISFTKKVLFSNKPVLIRLTNYYDSGISFIIIDPQKITCIRIDPLHINNKHAKNIIKPAFMPL